MRPLAVIRALGPVDFRSVTRDSLLAWFVFVPLLMALLLRWLLPRAAAWTVADFDFALEPYFPLIISYFLVLQAPMVVGMVVGFLLLDERDDRTVTALLVTPLSLTSYLTYRIGLPLIVCLVTTLLAFRLIGLHHGLSAFRLTLVLLVASMEAPLMALFLGSFAENKVQGFALLKALGVLLLAAALAWFVPLPWQYLLGILPAYWPAKAFWVAEGGGGDYRIFCAVGFAVHAALLWLLIPRFRKTLAR